MGGEHLGVLPAAVREKMSRHSWGGDGTVFLGEGKKAKWRYRTPRNRIRGEGEAPGEGVFYCEKRPSKGARKGARVLKVQ